MVSVCDLGGQRRLQKYRQTCKTLFITECLSGFGEGKLIDAVKRRLLLRVGSRGRRLFQSAFNFARQLRCILNIGIRFHDDLNFGILDAVRVLKIGNRKYHFAHARNSSQPLRPG